jgi:hypothetical protein
MYTATFKFKINKEGQWTADFKFNFDQIKLPPYQEKDPDRCGPFYFQDFTRLKSNTARRARKLAKPEWDQETGRNDMEYWDLLQKEVKLNAVTDFSFNYHYRDSGNWDEWQQYAVEVSNKTTVDIPERQSVFSIPLTSIKKNATSNRI